MTGLDGSHLLAFFVGAIFCAVVNLLYLGAIFIGRRLRGRRLKLEAEELLRGFTEDARVLTDALKAVGGCRYPYGCYCDLCKFRREARRLPVTRPDKPESWLN